MLQPNFFNSIFVFPIINILVAFYNAFLYLKIPGAFGFSIIALTVLIRFLFQPFFHQQMHTAKKMQELKPHLDKLSAKHKKDPKKLQQEQMRLYQEAGINPAAGCLVMIVQLPVFIALYNTLSLVLNGGGKHIAMSETIKSINKILYFPALKITSIDPHFFGLDIALSPAKAGIWYYYLIPLITAGLQYLQVQYSTPQAPVAEKKEGSKDDAKKSDSSDFQQAMNTQMKYIFPLMIGYFSYNLPIGLALYWNIFSLFSIIQYRSINSKPKLQISDSEKPAAGKLESGSKKS